MRNLAFLAVGLLLILAQGNLYRLLGAISLNGATPSLILPLVVFLGVHEASLARGAVLSAAFGYSLDVLAGAPIGLFTFVMVSVFWLARVAGVRLTAQTVLTQMSLAGAFAVVEGGFVLVLLAIFGSDAQRPIELASIVLPRALATAIVAPVIFRIAQRLHREGVSSARAAEGTLR